MVKKTVLGLLKKMKFLPQECYVKIYYEYYTGKKLDLRDPKEFNQKIQWLKVYYRKPILNQLVDKYAVREYVRNTIGEEHLNELLAVYDKPSQVDFGALPDKFVLKAVHGFHFNLLVPDKAALNKGRARYLLNKWMHKNQYTRGGMEWAYKDVRPRIIAERYLEELGKSTINDYKFFCFNGKPKFLLVIVEREQEDYRCYYDLQWNKMPFTSGNHSLFEGEIEKPANFDRMVQVAESLAGDFPFVRVDLYNIEGKIYFGEMTFYPTDGRKEYRPNRYNEILGSYIELPKIPPGQKYIT